MTTPAPTFSMTHASPAKVNLSLRIVGRRADGYHLIDSIFAKIDLSDQVQIAVSDLGPHRETDIEVRCAYPGVPTDDTNLAARAARTVLDENGFGARVLIEITKRIPPGAGLGGGSSNAATVLMCLNSLPSLHIPKARLRELALRLGADVPFFLTPGCARVRGIGEDIESIRGWPDLPLVVTLPKIAVSTAWVFRSYSAGFTRGVGEADRLASGSVPDASLLVNDLETVVLSAFPEIAQVKRALLEAGASAAVMSGSGSAVVGLVPSSTTPETVVAAFQSTMGDVRAECTRVLSTRILPSVDQMPSYA